MDTDKLSPEEAEKVDQIYRNHEYVARAVALSILKEPYLAEDCVHNVMEKYARMLQTGETDNIQSDKAYIIMMTKNDAIDILRKRKREDLKGFDLNVPHREGETNPEVYVTMDEYGFSAEVSEILEDVKEIDKEILFLNFKRGYSYKEIGLRIGKDANYVSQRVYQLKKRMKKGKRKYEKKKRQGVEEHE